MGRGGRAPRRRRDPAHEHGPRRHQRRLRPPADARRGAQRQHPGHRERRRRRRSSTSRRSSSRRTPTRCWRPARCTTACSACATSSAHMHDAGHPGPARGRAGRPGAARAAHLEERVTPAGGSRSRDEDRTMSDRERTARRLTYDAAGLIPAIVQHHETRRGAHDGVDGRRGRRAHLRDAGPRGSGAARAASTGTRARRAATSSTSSRSATTATRTACSCSCTPTGPACHTGERTCFYRTLVRPVRRGRRPCTWTSSPQRIDE